VLLNDILDDRPEEAIRPKYYEKAENFYLKAENHKYISIKFNIAITYNLALLYEKNFNNFNKAKKYY
jgi:hypothetical protein